MSLPIVSAGRTSKPSGDFVYFAYGSSLDFDAFREWCTQHGYRLPELSASQPATLEGFALVFNVRSRFWGGGTASIERRDGASVHGIAIPLSAEARGLVQHKEGAASGL
ncbi:MAG: gamma-glutamylcyclotransferase family protein, partial [Myxococcales bacterium]